MSMYKSILNLSLKLRHSRAVWGGVSIFSKEWP